MEIPVRYVTIIDDIVSRTLSYVEKGRVPAPTLIKGGAYSGVNVIVHEIYKKLSIQKDKILNVKFLRLRLSDSSLTNEILRELSLLGRSSKKPSIFFIDGIDRVLNLPARNLKKEAKTGRNSKAIEIIEESHKLRKILLENVNKFSIISSAGPSSHFMEDPDLPFYKFFNETTVNAASAEESVKYFFGLIKKNNSFDSKSSFIDELGEISFEWPYIITGGNWLLLQRLYQILLNNIKMNAASTSRDENSTNPLDEYFLQLQPMFLLEMSSYSREERRFIENAALLGVNFKLKNLVFENGNSSLIAKQLVNKGIIDKIENSVGGFTFSHLALRTLLRYFTGANLIDVFSNDNLRGFS
ncbi:MAG: hypothetical protein HQK51_17215 [Oligoflexia bacterium]|nr:hypothetical protein [Oligoflexia bacterium]